MNKLTKISVTALFALFLTACDKPIAKADAQTESAVSAQEAVKVVDTGEADYKAFRDWQRVQEQALDAAVKNAFEKLTEKEKNDPVLMQEVINKTLLTQLDTIKASASELNIQNSEVNALKDKTLEVLTLGAQMITESAKVEKEPTPEAHKVFAELQNKLNQVATEGQKLEDNLRAKYMPQEAATEAVNEGKEAVPADQAQ